MSSWPLWIRPEIIRRHSALAICTFDWLVGRLESCELVKPEHLTKPLDFKGMLENNTQTDLT